MTRRSLNLAEFWLTLAFCSIPVPAFALAGYLRFGSGLFPSTSLNPQSYVAWMIATTMIWALLVVHLGLNRVGTLATLQTGVKTAAKVTGYSIIATLSLVFFYRAADFSRIFVVMGSVFLFLFSLAMIHVFRGILLILNRSSNGGLRIAILGADDLGVRLAHHLSRNSLIHCEVACFVALPGQVPTASGAPVLDWERLPDIVERHQCREVLVILPPDRHSEMQQILNHVQHLCVPARVVLDLGEGVFLPDRIFDFYGLSLLDVRPYPVDSIGYAIGKRVFDIGFSLLALATGAPMMLAIAVGIKLSSRGPVFFAQERVSLNGKHFEMLKFRTMCAQDHETSDTQHTLQNDPRVTPIGRFLRRTSLDEFPQFFNVLRGDMSVVGPRPELTFFVQKFREEIPAYMARHNVKCGITGWAQINGLRGSDTSIPERIKHDLYYMRNWSMALDLKIILRTILSVFADRHAY